MQRWHTYDIKNLINTIENAIDHYESDKWFWQSNHADIDKLKKIIYSSNKSAPLNNQQLWQLFDFLHHSVNSEDIAANNVIKKVKSAFPYFEHLIELKEVDRLKDNLLDIVFNGHRPTIISVLKKLQQLCLFSNDAIRLFAIQDCYTADYIIKYFKEALDEKLFHQLITLRRDVNFLGEEHIATLSTHPNIDTLFHLFSLMHDYASCDSTRITSTIIAHGESLENANLLSDIVKTIESSPYMLNKQTLDLIGITPLDRRATLLYALHSLLNQTDLCDVYVHNACKMITALLYLNILDSDNVNIAFNHIKDENMAHALHDLGKFALNLNYGSTTLTFNYPLQYYFNMLLAHPYPKEIAYCLKNWIDYRTMEDLETCLTIKEPHTIRLLTRFIESATLNHAIFCSILQLDHAYKSNDLKDIADAFFELYNYRVSDAIWSDDGAHFVQLCNNVENDATETKANLINYAHSIKQKANRGHNLYLFNKTHKDNSQDIDEKLAKTFPSRA